MNDLFEQALNKYQEKFGENYPLLFPSTQTDEEIIERIYKCIETNTKEKKPEYSDDIDY